MEHVILDEYKDIELGSLPPPTPPPHATPSSAPVSNSESTPLDQYGTNFRFRRTSVVTPSHTGDRKRNTFGFNIVPHRNAFVFINVSVIAFLLLIFCICELAFASLSDNEKAFYQATLTFILGLFVPQPTPLPTPRSAATLVSKRRKVETTKKI